MDFDIVLLPGDGIGPELTDGAVAVLSAIERKFGHNFNMREMPIGGSAVDLTGVPLPEDTLYACKNADGVILGAVGGEKWNDIKPHNRPERAIRTLYAAMGLHAGIYPVAPLSANLSKLKNVKNANILLVRDLYGGTNSGEHGYRDGVLGQEAFDTIVYSICETESIARVALALAAVRKNKITSVDKADALYSGKIWRATVERLAKTADVTLESEYAESFIESFAANPEKYDVVLVSNLIGTLLVPMLSAVPGFMGLMPMYALGNGKTGVYGGAQNTFVKHDNPVGTILASAMLLSSLGLSTEAAAIEKAVKKTLSKGLRTADIANGKKYVSCARMSEEIAMTVLNT